MMQPMFISFILFITIGSFLLITLGLFQGSAENRKDVWQKAYKKAILVALVGLLAITAYVVSYLLPLLLNIVFLILGSGDSSYFLHLLWTMPLLVLSFIGVIYLGKQFSAETKPSKSKTLIFSILSGVIHLSFAVSMIYGMSHFANWTAVSTIAIVLTVFIALIIIFYMVQFSIVMQIADAKKIKRRHALTKVFKPILGISHIKANESEADTFMLSRALNQKIIIQTAIKAFCIVFTLVVAYWSLSHPWLLVRMFAALVLIVSLFIHQSIVVSIADKRGYHMTTAGIIGLIPIAGFVYYLTLPSKRNIVESTVRKTYSGKEIFGRAVLYIELVILAFIVLIPIIYLLGAALTDSTQIPYTLWPDSPSMVNFRILFEQKWLRSGASSPINIYYLYWFRNTLLIAVVNMFASVLFITGTAYVFARFKFKGKKFGLLSIMILQMFPSFLALVAIYILFDTFGLIGRPLALVIIYTGGAIPFNVWLIKGYLQGIPKDLDESATIDGANKLQIFFKIILPLSLPIITFVAVGQFMAPWLDYILPSYILRGTGADAQKNWTLAVGLFRFLQQADAMYRPTLFAAGALIIAIPITILYITFQKYLIEGLTAGATKG